jgi:Ca2+-transporting ATPase
MDASEVLKSLDARPEGLSVSEFHKRVARFGPNALPKTRRDGAPVVFLRQFSSPLMLILLAAAAVSGALGERADAAIIAAAVALNAVIGFVQEYKANRALERLRSFLQPVALVRRAEGEARIPAADVVPGDILVLKAGDRVPADARVISAAEIEANESALTGESMPVAKSSHVRAPDTTQAERSNMVYAGTVIVGGHGTAAVVATGTDTEFGRIASMVAKEPETDTPLQDELRHFSRQLSAIVLAIVAFLFALGLLRGNPLFAMFKISVALAVAAVPEGLLVAITVVLAIGAQRIYRRHALVRRLIAAETLGSVSVICTDKTGTITVGDMRVSEMLAGKGPVRPFDANAFAMPDIRAALEIGALCNDGSVGGNGTGAPDLVGSPTDVALLRAALDAGLPLRDLLKRSGRADELPFDSARKFMLTRSAWRGKDAILAKGAHERVLPFCTRVLEDGKERAWSAASRSEAEREAEEMTKRGLRVIAVAYRPAAKASGPLTGKDRHGLVFAGLLALRDPLRPEAAASIRAARLAGVRTVLITGDHPRTAASIAREVGLLTDDAQAALGSDVESWSEAELRRRVRQTVIYARAEPAHKIRIVKALQDIGEVVAMAGDGVNDAPALKAADIGIALGSGTEVAKESSDLVLLDNNLATITAAIEEGRVLFDNIRKTTVYLLLDSFTEIVLIGGALLLGMPLPLLAVQVLWINLVADSLPAIALTVEPGEPDVMRLPPRPRSEPVLSREMLFYVFGIGLFTDLVLLPVFAWYLAAAASTEVARTVMFAAVGIDSLIYVFAVKSFRRPIWRIAPFSNVPLVLAVLAGFALMGLALTHPFFQAMFEVRPLALSDLGVLLMMALLKLGAIEIAKAAFLRRRPPAKA